jgi:hypothetical protein
MKPEPNGGNHRGPTVAAQLLRKSAKRSHYDKKNNYDHNDRFGIVGMCPPEFNSGRKGGI